MKKKVHPPYQQVLFVDSASGHRFVCGSTLQPKATEKFQGAEYPVSYLSISSTSHPFFTGSRQHVDAEGRVEKFRKRFEKKMVALQETAVTSTDVGSDAKQAVKKPATKATPKKKA